MISISSSTINGCLAASVTFFLVACEPTTPANQDKLGELDGLPLTAGSRVALQADLNRIAALSKGQGCTEQEIDFITVSLKGFAVGMDQPLTEPWNASEKAQFDALMQRWQSLGGDSRDVSVSCRRRLASLKLPIL